MTKRGAGSAGANWRRRMWAEGLAPRSLKSTPEEAPPPTTTTPQGVAAAARPGGETETPSVAPAARHPAPRPPAAPQPPLFPASNPGQGRRTFGMETNRGAGGAVSPGEARLGPRLLHPLLRGCIAATAEIAALPGRGHRLPSLFPPSPSAALAPAAAWLPRRLPAPANCHRLSSEAVNSRASRANKLEASANSLGSRGRLRRCLTRVGI
ncbi:sterile alpha motif domain-containing protein 1-like isoform X2 [Moschus berezovskii]|nr:sterile alpha motif domain-containing protein 1-like isoform X2 [Moschus berezovskii]